MAKTKAEASTPVAGITVAESDEIRYIGEGSYVLGIPARNLSGAEWNELPVATQRALLAQNLYVLPDGVEPPAVEEVIAPAQATVQATAAGE